ncbi:Retrovirus-related Gag polyprotein from transposon opus [Eumeta japonica]|uniref:Retrovirus-related Gag polyprotein from transposon opus n=1 Tax=Eumeta variegata TaxID=151549 RepID=A0A4C1TM24_EUMVA|nr:Retrovirus-related Gag polyprotein from transposon opus [Eumeta japonica]
MNNELNNQPASVTVPPVSSGLAAAQMDVFQSLRIPDAIKQLPTFDGNPRLLYEFINNVEEILLFIRGTDKTPYGQILLRAIRNKIEGQANEVLNMYGTPLNWDDIKGNLITHYSDKRSETSLIKDLHNLKQYGKTFEKFYSEIVELQSALCNNILLHEADKNVISAKKSLYGEMCLNSFVTGLKDPLGSTIRAMRPNSLAEALDFCIKEQNIYYQQGPSRSFSNRYNHQYRQNNNPYLRDRYYNRPSYSGHLYGNSNTLVPTITQKMGIRNTNPNNNMYNQQQRQPSFNNNYGNNFNHQKQTFLGNNIPRLPQPEPMDISSGFTHLRTRNSFPSIKQSPSSQIRRQPNMEINMHEIREEYELTNVEEEVNFQESASQSPRDT